MEGPIPANSSGTARLLLGAPGYGIGQQDAVPVASPAAGAQWSYTVDGRYHERLVCVFAVFQASAVVASRAPLLQLADVNGKVMVLTPVGAGVAASARVTATLAVNSGISATAGGGAMIGYLPDLLIPPGWRWSTTVTNMDAGDQWSSIYLLIQRYPNDVSSMPVVG